MYQCILPLKPSATSVNHIGLVSCGNKSWCVLDVVVIMSLGSCFLGTCGLMRLLEVNRKLCVLFSCKCSNSLFWRQHFWHQWILVKLIQWESVCIMANPVALLGQVLESIHMYLAPQVIITEFDITFDVVISAVRIVITKGYLIKFPPPQLFSHNVGPFLCLIIHNNLCVCYHLVFWNGLNIAQIHG